MVNYQNGKVYKIINEKNEIVYIGSTSQKYLSYRYTGHHHNKPNHKIILIENYSCNSREELRKREQEIIEEHNDLTNKINAYCSEEDIKKRDKEYYQNNKEKIKEKNKKYYQNNKEKIKEKNKKYSENNKEKRKEYNENNSEKIKEYHKKYRENNSEKLKEYNKKYKENNSEKIKQIKKKYYENNKIKD
jgi:hypothetical protein